jgi:lipopolysaccharide export LptBFGC system permease protein LptF
MADTLARYVLRLAGARFVLLFVVFMGVLVGGQFAILLGRGVPPEAALPVLATLALLSLPLAFPLALSTALLVALGAMNQDGEVRALAAGGVGHRAILRRLLPLVAAGVLVCALLVHVVLPGAVADLRANKGRLLQTAIAERVASGDPVLEKSDSTVWVGSAEGGELRDIHALLQRGGSFIAAYAPQATWGLDDGGIRIEARDLALLQRDDKGKLMAVDAERWSYVHREESAQGKVEPDAMSTPQVWQLAHQRPAPGKSPSVYNDARLSLQFRFFLPLALAAFCCLAMGLGLAFGTAQNLAGVAIMVVVVALVTYPAFGYVKANNSRELINPGFLLWPPAVLVALIGLWLCWWPQRAREQLAAAFALLSGRRSR